MLHTCSFSFSLVYCYLVNPFFPRKNLASFAVYLSLLQKELARINYQTLQNTDTLSYVFRSSVWVSLPDCFQVQIVCIVSIQNVLLSCMLPTMYVVQGKAMCSVLSVNLFIGVFLPHAPGWAGRRAPCPLKRRTNGKEDPSKEGLVSGDWSSNREHP